MYNLKKIYGVISFEFEEIRLLVVEKNEGKTNLIYFDKIKESYYDSEKMTFINEKDIQAKLMLMLKNADTFIGNQVKRYIVNNCMFNFRVVENESPTFLVFDQTLTQKNFKNYLSKINFLDTKTDELIVKIHPIEWKLDGKSFKDFPLGEIGSNIRFKYLAYVSKRATVYQFANLIESLKINILSYESNELCFGGLIKNIAGSSENVVAINIGLEKTSINFFDGGNLAKISTINFGSRKIELEIKNKFGISKDSNITPLLKTLKYLNPKDKEVVVINIHNSNFLSVKEATNTHIQILIQIILKKIVKEAIAEIDLRSKETNVSYDKMFMHIDDSIFQDICKNISPDSLGSRDISFFEVNAIGLLEENIVNLIGAVETTIYEQETNREIVYSVDAFLPQEVFNQQTKKQIMIKLGVLSTKWSAKLGE